MSGGIPAHLAITRPLRRRRWLRRFLSVWAALPGLAWLVPAPFVVVLSLLSPEVFVYDLPLFGLGLMRGVGAGRLYEQAPGDG